MTMKFKTPIFLASKSPRRKELLQALGIEFQSKPPEVTEDWPLHLPPLEVPGYLARRKAAALATTEEDATIIAADTVVILNNSIMSKPKTREKAFGMLSSLSGKTHQVVTGVCIQNKENIVLFKDITFVTFRPLATWEIDYYLDNYQPYDKAGAYGIQEWMGMVGIKGIRGCYYNVMGLPVQKVYTALLKLQSGE